MVDTPFERTTFVGIRTRSHRNLRLVELAGVMRSGMRIRRQLAAMWIVGGIGACGDVTTVEPAPAIPSLTVVDGDGQQALANFPLPDSLRVRVTDQGGKPLSGVSIGWSASTGEISPVQSTTDAEGETAAAWKFYSPATGRSAVGTHTARAGISGGVGFVNFTGYARAGVVLRSVSITPQFVDVTSSAAVVTATVRVTDDRTGLGLSHADMQFFNVTNPAAGYAERETWYAVLNRVSGTPADGVWQGTITVPQGTSVGVRKLSLNLSWGCGAANRKYVYDAELRSLGMADQVVVTATTSQPDRLPAPSADEGPLRFLPGLTPAGLSSLQNCA